MRTKRRKKQNRKIQDAIRILILLIALSVLSYPVVSNYLYQKNQSRVITRYNEEAVKLSKSEKEQMLEEARAYNEEMLGNIELLDPFSTKKKEVNERYESILNVNGSGMMGYIRIPAIEVELPIYHGTSETVLQTGVGHFEGTSFPVGGESTHTVLTGHRGLSSKILFTDIDKLKIDDVFYIKILDETFVYKIDQILTVLPEETKELSIVAGQDYATLVTCTPYSINTHRLLVRGHRIPYEEVEQTADTEEAPTMLSFQLKILIWTILFLLIIFLVLGVLEVRKKRKRDTKKTGIRRNKDV